MQTRYSVIVPVFNLEKVISRCIESILSQTIDNFELILVDDGSEDSSYFVCCAYAQRDSRVRVIHQENRGVSAARNAGLANAEGKYIVFVDGDDYVSADYLQELDDSNAELVSSGFVTLDENGKPIACNEYSPGAFLTSNRHEIRKMFENSVFNNVYSKRFIRSIIQENGVQFDEKLDLGEDTCFSVSYISKIRSIETLSAVNYFYIKYQSKDTLTNKRVSKDVIDSLEASYTEVYHTLRSLLGDEASPATAYRLGMLYREYIRLYMNDSDWINREAVTHLFRQYWFRESLKDPRLYADENRKFVFLLNFKSGIPLILYKGYQKIKRR